ncbi:hypothetical protein E2C01_042823 [Portunus trituberculatus]|uniref:Uncharacterized protein n=1 Tax=Portunus trituberculatus TaxID=210409 RepID=A0A5B7FUL8_PORTR|nr:hypothetical protein [Portunus trituberculatus]
MEMMSDVTDPLHHSKSDDKSCCADKQFSTNQPNNQSPHQKVTAVDFLTFRSLRCSSSRSSDRSAEGKCRLNASGAKNITST